MTKIVVAPDEKYFRISEVPERVSRALHPGLDMNQTYWRVATTMQLEADLLASIRNGDIQPRSLLTNRPMKHFGLGVDATISLEDFSRFAEECGVSVEVSSDTNEAEKSIGVTAQSKPPLGISDPGKVDSIPVEVPQKKIRIEPVGGGGTR